ncbi:hypothetical protein B0H10DRAFT_721655 [Mycena sp. CBHHK59/15]|nr:hypothetical protein B0H10DRAFT_721655 [Mycena sp. CBHHK59/15]
MFDFFFQQRVSFLFVHWCILPDMSLSSFNSSGLVFSLFTCASSQTWSISSFNRNLQVLLLLDFCTLWNQLSNTTFRQLPHWKHCLTMLNRKMRLILTHLAWTPVLQTVLAIMKNRYPMKERYPMKKRCEFMGIISVGQGKC